MIAKRAQEIEPFLAVEVFQRAAAEQVLGRRVGHQHAAAFGVDDPGRLAEMACARAGRNLTRGEWATVHTPDQAYTTTCPQWPKVPSP